MASAMWIAVFAAAAALLPAAVNSGSSLAQVLDIFDLSKIQLDPHNANGNITEQCSQDVETLLQALHNNKLWALKVYDACGRYTTGYFWGNGYWVGSETQCLNIEEIPMDTDSNITRTDDLTSHSSPIPLAFYKARTLLIPPAYISAPRTVLLGLCLPFSCSVIDVKTLINMQQQQRSINDSIIVVQRVKSPHELYLYWQDPVFWILTIVTSIIYILLIIGTMCDYISDGKLHALRLSHTINKIADSTEKCSTGEETPENRVPSTGDREAVWKEVVLSFSVRRNMRTICDESVGEDTIATIHGIRFFSMCWVIMGHTCIIIFKYSDNMEFRALMEKQWTFQTITNAPFAVDSFFFISGLLVSFLYFRTTAKIDVSKITRASGFKSNTIQFFGLIIYRFCRLTSPYLFIIGCVQISMQYFENNALFDPPTDDHINCPKYWWRNALYINTLYPVEQMCMLWSWYLADDTQFYILGLALLITAFSHLKTAAGLLIAFMVSSWVTTAYVAYENNHKPSEDDPLALFDKIYDKPWTRLGPYLIGIMVGWLLYKSNCKLRINKAMVVLGWTLSIGGMMYLVYGLHGQQLDRMAGAAFSSLSHSAWAICLAWVVVACSTGHGGIVNSFLSASCVYPFSRVTYCAYLVHPIVIRQIIITIDSPLHLSQTFMFLLYLGVVSASYGLSFIVSLMFEAPVVSLLRLLSPKRANRQPTMTYHDTT